MRNNNGACRRGPELPLKPSGSDPDCAAAAACAGAGVTERNRNRKKTTRTKSLLRVSAVRDVFRCGANVEE